MSTIASFPLPDVGEGLTEAEIVSWKVKPGDTVIYSAKPIPGNEKGVADTVDLLLREGAKIYQATTGDIDDHGILHVSGHASRDDIIDLVNMVQCSSGE